MDRKQMVTYLNDELYEKVRKYAYDKDITKSKAIEKIIEEYFKLKEKNLEPKE